MNSKPKFIALLVVGALISFSSAVFASSPKAADKPIMLRTMGSLTFGGNVYTNDKGESFHGDHGYAQYFIPQQSREYPLVMWHGYEESGQSWETTPDGREGYMQIFARRDWSVYVIDQPGRGRAGRSQLKFMDPKSIPASSGESGAWSTFRLGEWTPGKKPSFFPGVQFPKDDESVNQFLRWQTPDTGIISSQFVDNGDYMGQTMGNFSIKLALES